MKILHKSAVLSLASLLMSASLVTANADDTDSNAVKYEKTSDAGTIIFRIENIQPVKDKQGEVTQCSYVVTAYNRLDNTLKEANLDFIWNDNITGKYLKKIDDSSKLDPDEIANNLSSEVDIGEPTSSFKSEAKFKPIVSSVKLFNIAPHSQKSFSNSVDTDKCFLLFDNLNFEVKDCTLDGGESEEASNCSDKFNYINSKNPEYYAEFGDVPENIVQDQIEDEKNTEIEKVNNRYKEISEALDKVDETLKNMR
jgi:hypothetical protein